MNKKAIVTHPVTLFIAGVVIGMVIIILIVRGIVSLPIKICP